MFTQPQQQLSTESKPHLTFIQHLRHTLLHSQAKCQRSHPGLYVCINKTCQHPNPFICPQPQCTCSDTHQLCPQIRAKSFAKLFQRKDKILDQVLDNFNQRTDQLIDHISVLREKAIQKFKNGQDEDIIGSYVDKAWWAQHKKSGKAMDKTLTGQLINQIWEDDRKTDSQKKQHNVINSIDKVFNNFEGQIQTEFERIFKILLESKQIENFYWSKELRGGSQLINGRSVKKVSGSSSGKFSLLEPSLTKLNAKKVQWQFRIKKVAGWVGLGICVRSIVEKNKFDFLNYLQSNHGSYIVSSKSNTWSYQNPAQNANTINGILIQSGHQVAFDLDLETRILKYTNKTSQQTGAVNVVYSLQEGDAFHICSCLSSAGDEVEILGNVVVDGVWADVDENSQ